MWKNSSDNGSPSETKKPFSANLARRNMSKGQQAMAMAMICPRDDMAIFANAKTHGLISELRVIQTWLEETAR